MRITLFVLTAVLGGSLACNQAPGPAPAGAPTTQDTAPASTVPSTGSGGTPSGNTAQGEAAGTSAAVSAANPVGDQARPSASSQPQQQLQPPQPSQPTMMEMEVPAGTPLEIVLDTPASSATSKVEDAVRGHVLKAVAVSGMTTIPAGSELSGTVVEAKPSGKVQGRALIAVRFNRIIVAKTPYTIRTARIVREAAATKGEDAKKVGIGAGAGAIIGAIAGGKKGAAIGTAVGAGAGTGAVLATKGDEVSLGAGATVRTTIEEPVKINAPM